MKMQEFEIIEHVAGVPVLRTAPELKTLKDAWLFNKTVFQHHPSWRYFIRLSLAEERELDRQRCGFDFRLNFPAEYSQPYALPENTPATQQLLDFVEKHLERLAEVDANPSFQTPQAIVTALKDVEEKLLAQKALSECRLMGLITDIRNMRRALDPVMLALEQERQKALDFLRSCPESQPAKDTLNKYNTQLGYPAV